ncbi:MarR family winged helix-turn-helix transcriptional regulator [Kosmotoga arenicorallina]|nr:MarR family transcriptional regulator [Kosmotoga arenicorallina]
MEKPESSMTPREIFETLFDLTRVFTKYFYEQVEIGELKTAEFFIMLLVHLKGPKKMHEIADAFHLTRANTTILVDNMENLGYLKRERSNEDRRVVFVHITKKGKKLCESILNNFNDIVSDFLNKVPRDDIEIIEDAFGRLTRLFINGH